MKPIETRGEIIDVWQNGRISKKFEWVTIALITGSLAAGLYTEQIAFEIGAIAFVAIDVWLRLLQRPTLKFDLKDRVVLKGKERIPFNALETIALKMSSVHTRFGAAADAEVLVLILKDQGVINLISRGTGQPLEATAREIAKLTSIPFTGASARRSSSDDAPRT